MTGIFRTLLRFLGDVVSLFMLGLEITRISRAQVRVTPFTLLSS